ncbi:hypothetical protein B0T26DRAFT_644063, partial [Lasiosphaeria miniovina]
TNMSADNLVEFNAQHGVLICRECHYAIQKSALESHLLRHKIYRGRRRRLLASLAHFDVLDPDDVQLPPAGSPPVIGLPVIAGYRCTAAGCASLWASAKRMQRHWSETHGVGDSTSDDVAFSRPASLQTFFRGTKLRYFEVVLHSDDQDKVDQAPGAVVDITGNNPARQIEDDITGSTPELGTATSPDLEMLTYFHYFTTTTGLTLPVSSTGCTRKYWQADAVALSLQHSWLACGLLAISASHMATVLNINRDGTSVKGHVAQSARYFEQFSAAARVELRKRDSDSRDALRLGAQILCIQRCLSLLSAPALGEEEHPQQSHLLQLRSLVRAIRGCTDADFALRCCSTRGSNDEDGLSDDDEISTPDEGAAAENIPIRREPMAASAGGTNLNTAINNNTPPALANHLRTLTFRMSTAVAKPDSALDFFAALAAVDALAECCAVSYKPSANDDDRPAATWAGMAAWWAGPTSSVSDHFSEMVWRRNAAALVVAAQWSLLVERAERHCWFLAGAAAWVRRLVVKHLPDDAGIRSLVEDLPAV